MSSMSRDQRQRLRAAYEEFVRQASKEEKEDVDRLLQEVAFTPEVAAAASLQAPAPVALSPPATASTREHAAIVADVATASTLEAATDCPEIMHFLGALGRGPTPEAGFLRPVAGEVEALAGEIPVSRDGGLLGTGRYQVHDPRWIEAGIDWLHHLFHRVPFRCNPPRVRIPNQASLALVGDWGTGFFQTDSAAEGVARQIEGLAPDFTIHLGDIYYAGRRAEVRDHFLAHWPGGRLGSFAINSNHEMYTGGFGYFEDLLGDPRFEAQEGNSYFALENDDWVIVGLDSAYHANRFRLYRRGRIDDSQIEFLATLAKEAGGRRLMVLTHHQGLELDSSVREPLWSQVREGLGGCPAVWYWGHVHSGVMFPRRDGIEPRCCGFGGMPRARAASLEENPEVVLFERRLAGDPRLPQRVVSGFTHLQLSPGEVTETFYDELGRVLSPHLPGD